MNKIFNNPSSVKLPQADREAEHEEYGREHKGVAVCPMCRNVHFKKMWHAPGSSPKHEEGVAATPTREELCPACKMVKEHLFEGELFVEEVPAEHKTELLNLIHNVGRHATEIDPQHRIIDIEETDKGLRVTTTENQLVDRIAKKIQEAFKAVDVHSSHSKEPYEVDRVHAVFHS